MCFFFLSVLCPFIELRPFAKKMAKHSITFQPCMLGFFYLFIFSFFFFFFFFFFDPLCKSNAMKSYKQDI